MATGMLRTLLLALATYSVAGCHFDRPSAPTPLDRTIDGVRWEPGDWTPDLEAGPAGTSKGNHRAVLRIDTAASAVFVRIPWRRPDPDPGAIAVVFVDAVRGDTVLDVVTVESTPESGSFVFRPLPGASEYHAYYYPYRTTGGYYPDVSFLSPESRADPSWIDELGALDRATVGSFPSATVTAIQSIDDFHDFFPMEVIATEQEMESLRSPETEPFLLFPEDRSRPIRMRHGLPRHWAADGPRSAFGAVARPGEYYTFQVGVFASDTSLADLQVDIEGFDEASSTCFNTAGIDLSGRTFAKRIDVPRGQVQALWFGIDLAHVRSGKVEGVIRVSASGIAERAVAVNIQVQGEPVPNHGFDDPASMSRLAWLNSTIGDDPDFVIEPYEPVRVEESTLHILGRAVHLATTGLPARIVSGFAPDMTGLASEVDILARPIEFEVQGEPAWRSVDEPHPEQVASGRAEWTATSRSDRFDLVVHGALEYDGMLDYRIELVAREDAQVSDVRMPVAYEPEAATWILGLGFRGGRRPESIDWTWNVENHQEGVWMGAVNRGLQYVLRDRNYVRPLNTNFYRNQPLNLPPSWYNSGKGGIRIHEEDGAVVATNYSGFRTVAAGDTLHFHVRFLITPFRPLDTKTQFSTRFVHQYVPVDTVKAWGGTVVNIHHANPINPYINYPFFALDELKAYIDEAHAKGIKVKLYYTIRELTYKAYELFALRSLGDEIFNDGEDGGHPWLQEHIRDRYHKAWHAWRVDDAAILDKGTSRWTNYYVEGLNWLAEKQQIDGLYLDDIAFSRETVKRMVSVLHRHRSEVVIDLHSANQYNVRDGWINSAMLYMEHFPYVSRLWFGEYFDYDRGPDYWLTEVSGIPFGLMGEMLQDGGHPYRGLLYGMTARKYGDVDPRPVWSMMTDFGIADSRMLGYWLKDAPVRTGDPDVLATTYSKPGGALVVLASWADSDRRVYLDIDWHALGFDGPTGMQYSVIEVDGLQEPAVLSLSDPVAVPANQGLYLIVQSRGADSRAPSP